MNLVYTEEAERLIASENGQWAAYAEYPLLFEQELDEAIEGIQKQPYRPVYAISSGGLTEHSFRYICVPGNVLGGRVHR